MLAERIAEEIKRQIKQGQLPAGSRLASLRDYAESYGAAKNTVVQAYELLVADGVIEPRRGAGFFVTGRDPGPRLTDRWAPALDLALRSAGIHPNGLDHSTQAFSLGEGLPPSSWLESCRLDRYMQKIGRSGLGTVFRYGDPYGYLPLRRNIALKLQGHGIPALPNQIVLTQGSYQAVNIVIRHFVKAGDHVLVDDPGFYPTFGKLRLQGAQILGVPRRPDGPDLDYLTTLLRRHKPRLFFTQSIAHNPTASDMSPQVIKELVALANHHGIILVDDDALSDFKPPSTPRIGTLDQLAHSIHIGSFSKSLSSVVRVGFLACNAELARDLTDVKTVLSLNSSLYAERTVDAVITEGRFRKHVAALRTKARKMTLAALNLFDRKDMVIFSRPEHSLYLWARFPGVEDSVGFTRRILSRGIVLAPGAIFSPNPEKPSPWFRFNVGFIGAQSRFNEVVAASREHIPAARQAGP